MRSIFSNQDKGFDPVRVLVNLLALVIVAGVVAIVVATVVKAVD